MKFVIALALVAVVAARPEDTYGSKYDNFNIDEVISNGRLLKSYADCFTGTGKCTPEGQDIKEKIPEGIQTACAKCTDKQKPMVAKFIVALREKVPEKWKTLNEQHNLDGKYNEEIDNFLKEYGH